MQNLRGNIGQRQLLFSSFPWLKTTFSRFSPNTRIIITFLRIRMVLTVSVLGDSRGGQVNPRLVVSEGVYVGAFSRTRFYPRVLWVTSSFKHGYVHAHWDLQMENFLPWTVGRNRIAGAMCPYSISHNIMISNILEHIVSMCYKSSIIKYINIRCMYSTVECSVKYPGTTGISWFHKANVMNLTF